MASFSCRQQRGRSGPLQLTVDNHPCDNLGTKSYSGGAVEGAIMFHVPQIALWGLPVVYRAHRVAHDFGAQDAIVALAELLYNVPHFLMAALVIPAQIVNGASIA